MKKLLLALLAVAVATNGIATTKVVKPESEPAEVYFTHDISPNGLMKAYKALNRPLEGKKVAVKISTGEAGNNHYLHPELIGDFVQSLKGDIVECNTAYAGKRMKTSDHRQTIEDHGFNAIAKVVIMDEFEETEIPTPKGSVHLKNDLIGAALKDYDGFVILNHFKGHQMGGFGGALKNLSIGCGSSRGKSRIHTAGRTDDLDKMWEKIAETPQKDFIESMAEAAGAVVDFMGDRAVYISVMNNISIDCDCNGHPAKPEMADVGILASLDPVALDKACVDLVYASDPQKSASLRARMEKQLGPHILDHAEKLGYGKKAYKLISLDGTNPPSTKRVDINDMKYDPKDLPENWSPIPVGEPNDAYAQYFTGKSYLTCLTKEQVPAFGVTFEPACRNNWHVHKAKTGGGQILICTAGRGFYQEEGKPAVEMTPGVTVNIPAGVKHWHGAAPDSWFQHIAIEVPGTEQSNEWLEPVDDAAYEKVVNGETEPQSKTAVIYFSWSPDGNTRFAAETIAKKAEADIFEIKAEKPYSEDYRACCDEAKPECYGKKTRAIKKIEGLDLSKYEFVFFGTPNWWGTMAPPLRTFVKENLESLKGKKVCLFQTHGGGGMQRVGEEFEEEIGKAATVLAPMAFSGSSVRSKVKELEKFAAERTAEK